MTGCDPPQIVFGVLTGQGGLLDFGPRYTSLPRVEDSQHTSFNVIIGGEYVVIYS